MDDDICTQIQRPLQGRRAETVIDNQQRIVALCEAAAELAFDVLEVGPGPGGLTRGLLAEGARRVVAVEKDARCLPALAEIAAACAAATLR